MKIIYRPVFIVALLAVLLLSCNSERTAEVKSRSGEEVSKSEIAVPEQDAETLLLLETLREAGDYVNSREFPSLIKASAVSEGLDLNNLLLDIRTDEQFSSGHIAGSVNISFGDLPGYLSSAVKPFEYDRIVIISDDGQLAGYTTSLLRLMGYGNVYALRWGLSGWNSEYAEKGWLAATGSAYQDRLETTETERPAPGKMPLLGTGLSSGEEIADARFSKLFEEGVEGVSITADEVFTNPGNYYIINYDRKDKYESGHIPGAVRYKPGATLGFAREMASIPSERIVVVYCGTGHNSAFVTAYLRLFGYDARTLEFGNNSFMYDKMVSDRETLSWLPFTLADSESFELIK